MSIWTEALFMDKLGFTVTAAIRSTPQAEQPSQAEAVQLMGPTESSIAIEAVNCPGAPSLTDVLPVINNGFQAIAAFDTGTGNVFALTCTLLHNRMILCSCPNVDVL